MIVLCTVESSISAVMSRKLVFAAVSARASDGASPAARARSSPAARAPCDGASLVRPTAGGVASAAPPPSAPASG
eukprot:CAMPEP_0205891126 /NCGR_PEP_ID=MMETSP1083-20121108/21913_1 /ASSEMBLY_ACC=CAM_ASM_000430 /TAXON_ID=97485 /ORGANISM="Prymnesium parvum, Strain Texoma1" /LENGTH=74 /DNA_ID=CAMNT_0053255429 /DNA_START=240 /DNA_END=465 /DNA_ORIENTATION=-